MSLMWQTKHVFLAGGGDVELAGDGLDDTTPPAPLPLMKPPQRPTFSNDGDSPPMPSSDHMFPKSPRADTPEPHELTEPELQPELPDRMAGPMESVRSNRPASGLALQRAARATPFSSSVIPLPVRKAMCASISRLAVSTLSGRPVTSNTGSLSRDGVTMYVPVWCWMRLMVAPLGPTTSPTTL